MDHNIRDESGCMNCTKICVNVSDNWQNVKFNNVMNQILIVLIKCIILLSICLFFM